MTRSTFICLCAIVLGLAAHASAQPTQSAPPRGGGLGLTDRLLLAADSPAPLMAQSQAPTR